MSCLNPNLNAVLMLEDGAHFQCSSIGFFQDVFGEVVFNTSMSGYQEILTDPSYRGQMIVMTYPMIGNYGVNLEDVESKFPQVRAFIVKEMCRYPSNWRSQKPLLDYLIENQIVVVEHMDTRALVRHLRNKGAMRGLISTRIDNLKKLQQEVLNSPSMSGADFVKEVTCKEPYQYSMSGKYNVAAIDFGIKKSILDQLNQRNCKVKVFPGNSKPQDILMEKPDGVFLSNGPGDPAAVTYGIELVKDLLGKVPIFGICLGHQILSLALGGKTYKLKFGHRGGNHPVCDLSKSNVEITSQNHGFAVDAQTLKSKPVKITHINLNDQTVEGLRHLELPAFSVQHHPEASPGPHDARHLFDQFVELMEKEKHAKKN